MQRPLRARTLRIGRQGYKRCGARSNPMGATLVGGGEVLRTKYKARPKHAITADCKPTLGSLSSERGRR